MMTLDEAIEHAEEAATTRCGECAEEHAQLADWLRELKRARMKIDLLKILRDGFKLDAQKYKTENEELRELAMDAVRYAEPEFHIGLKYNEFCTRECQLRDSVCPSSDECKYPDYLHERLRKMGIEMES